VANNRLQFTHPQDSFPSSQGQPLYRSLSQLKPVQIFILFDPHNITVPPMHMHSKESLPSGFKATDDDDDDDDDDSADTILLTR